MPKQRSEDMKTQAVKLALCKDKTKKVPKMKICEMFGIGKSTLIRWVKQYQDTGDVEIKKRRRTCDKVKENYVETMKKILKEKNDLTIKELCEKMREEHEDFDVSERHMARVVKENNITLKKARKVHIPETQYGKKINIEEQIKTFYENMEETEKENIICVDETSLSQIMTRNNCRSEKGKRCSIKTKSQEVFRKYTGIFAIDVNGVVGWKVYDKGGINKERMKEFLGEILKDKEGKTVIMDNASSHRTEDVKKMVEEKNKLVYSVPYQHYTNAIEMYFGVMKKRLEKKEGKDLEKMKENIGQVIEEMEKEIYEKLIKGAYEKKEKREDKVRKNKKLEGKKYKK